MVFLAADNPLNHVTDGILVKFGDTPVLTMHMVTTIVIGALFVLVMMHVSKAIATGDEADGNERYVTKGRLAQLIEALIVLLRDEMLEPLMGKKDTRRYLPFLMTAFLFILFQNLFGLIPVVDLLHLVGAEKTWLGGTATANLMVTGALALISMVVIQVHAFRELGVRGWMEHHCGGLLPMPNVLFAPVVLLVFIVEVAGDFIKPAALAIRLFANMVGGHTLMAVLLSFGAMAANAGMGTFGWGSITLISVIAGVLIMFLEVFVAFLQAFIFMFLTAVFISLMSHHDEHEHDVGHEEEAIVHGEHELEQIAPHGAH